MRAGDPRGVSSAVARDGRVDTIRARPAGSGAGDPGLQHLQPMAGEINGLDRAWRECATASCRDRLHLLEGLRREGMARAPAQRALATHLAQAALGGRRWQPRDDFGGIDRHVRRRCRGAADAAGATAGR